MMFGYTDYDVIVVGAAGGRGGKLVGSGGGLTQTSYGSGGGGGASKRRQGKLIDLSPNVSVVVGAVGAKGPDVTGGGTIVSVGAAGGLSSFGSLSAEGGLGGDSGRIVGGSTFSYPIGGAGGSPTGSSRPVGGINGSQAPGIGTWDDVLQQGSGGGGNSGRLTQNIGNPEILAAGAGAAGSESTGNPYRSSGEAVQSVSYGGGGGGANIAPITGDVAEYYGSGWNNPATRNGVVVVKIS